MVIVTFEVELCLQLWRCLRKYYTYLEIFDTYSQLDSFPYE